MKQPELYKILVCSSVVFLLIFGTECFHITCWDYVIMGRLSYFIYGGVFLWSLFSLKRLPTLKLPLLPIILGMLTICLPSLFARAIVHGESPVEEFKIYVVPIYSALVFIILYAYRVSPKMLMRFISSVGLLIFVIQLIQIIFPEIAIFGVYSGDDINISYTSDEISEIRNGLHRYRIESYMITLLCLYYYWDRFLKRKELKYFVLFSIFLISLYFYLTRQLLLATIVTLALSFFFIRKKNSKIFFIAIAIFGLAALLKFSYALFANLLENVESEMTMDNVRVAAFAYFLSSILSGPLQFLFGNGHPSMLIDLQESMKIFSSDVGFVGAWYHYGVFWIVLYFVSVYLLLVKYKKVLPIYVKLFYLSTLFTSPLIFPYRSTYEYVIWAVALYISSLYIYGSAVNGGCKKKVKTTVNK